MIAAAAPVLVSGPLAGRRPASWWGWPGSPSGKAPVAAVAGLGLDGRTFRRFAPLAEDRELLLVNLPNALPPAPSMEDLAGEVFAALDAAGHGDRRCVLLGSSFGAMVCLAAVLARPERVAALVLVGGGTGWGDVSPALRLAASVHGLIPRRSYPRIFASVMLPPSRGYPPELREELRTQFLHRTKGFLGSCLAAMRTFDARPRLGEIRVPALVLHGDRDPVLSPAGAAAAAAAIPGARLVVVEDCGHLPHVTQGERTAAAVAGFLAENGL